MTKELWFDSQEGQELFLFSKVTTPALEPTHPPIQCAPGALSLEIIEPRHQAEHSLLSNANIQNEWNYTSTSMMPYALMVGVHLHLPLLLSVEIINHEKCLHGLLIPEASRIYKTEKYHILISPVDYTSHDDALG